MNIKKIKYGQKAYIFAYMSAGAVQIEKGTVTGIRKCNSIFTHEYEVSTGSGSYWRTPDVIWNTLEELKKDLDDMVKE